MPLGKGQQYFEDRNTCLLYTSQNIIERSLTIDANNIIFLKKWHVNMKMEF